MEKSPKPKPCQYYVFVIWRLDTYAEYLRIRLLQF
jgi:hypothetical protein